MTESLFGNAAVLHSVATEAYSRVQKNAWSANPRETRFSDTPLRSNGTKNNAIDSFPAPLSDVCVLGRIAPTQAGRLGESVQLPDFSHQVGRGCIHCDSYSNKTQGYTSFAARNLALALFLFCYYVKAWSKTVETLASGCPQ